MTRNTDETADGRTEVEVELSKEVVEYLEQDHIDADDLINALIAAERATSKGDSDE